MDINYLRQLQQEPSKNLGKHENEDLHSETTINIFNKMQEI